MIDSAFTRAKDIKIHLYISDNDQNAIKYDFTNTIVTIGPDCPTVHKWNILAEEAMKDPKNKLFMLGADDMAFGTPCWDEAIINHYNALEDKIHVYALRDSRDEDGTPHPIVTREYIEAMGYFLPPIFLHWFVDTWTVEIAKANNCFTHFKDFILFHHKPSDKGKADETYSRIRLLGWPERDSYVHKTMQDILYHERARLGALLSRRNSEALAKAIGQVMDI